MYYIGMKPKKKMGRPSMGDDARQIPLMVKITAKEKKVWASLAKAAGLPISIWLAKPRRDETMGSN